MKNIIKILAISFLSALITAGCTGKFDEINTDPDAHSKVPTTNQLGDVLRLTGSTMGNELDGYNSWAGHIVKIQYMDYLSGYIPTNNTYGNRWTRCYVNMSQLRDILARTEGEAIGNKNMRFVCRIWEEYMWLYLLDGWGDIPYSEAFKGSEGIYEAKYDKQEDIFPAVLANMKTIADEMAAELGTDKLGEGDFIYEGDIKKWQKFLNSLRLRAAMRISNVAETLAKSTIEEICGSPDKYPVIDSNDASCNLWWQGSGDYFEPWHNNRRGGRDDHGLSDIFIDHLKSMNDPRLASVAHPAASDGEYRGYPNGAPGNPNPLNSISRIGAIYRDDPAGFTPFFKACETYYIIAEAAQKGWNTGIISAKDAYERAVRLSMDENNVSNADADAYLAGTGQWNNTLERIWEDEWVALFKDCYEAWSLYRRTGIPDTNYPSLGSVWGPEHNDQPFRLPYPDSEYSFNKSNVGAAVSSQGIKDHCWGKQLWWDTRTGVK